MENTKRKRNKLNMVHSTFALAILSPFWFGLLFGSDTITYQSPHTISFVDVREVEAHEITPLERALKEIPHKADETKEVITRIYTEAPKYELNPDWIAHTIYCESMFYNIQSGIVVEGVREPSYGLAQIHLPSHPEVTVEQALDPLFSVDWMMEHWSDEKWYGYDRTTDTCTNDIDEYWK